MFVDDAKVWKRQTAAYKTWAHFKRDFVISHREFREAKVTSAGAGYQSANAAAYQQDTANAIANLATATAHDCQTVANLSATNNTLTLELTAVNRKLVAALFDVNKLTKQLAELQHKYENPTPPLEPKHYCWSCGYRQTHYSSRCLNPKVGHQKSAKASDIMGGSTLNQA
jgi:hypothetical protein